MLFSYVHIQSHWRFSNLGTHSCFERLMGFAFIVVVCHILEAGKGALGSKGVALAARVIVQFVAFDREDVRLAVLMPTRH